MKNRAKQSILTFILSVAVLSFSSAACRAGTGIELYTPYTKISVPPGESVEYTIDVRNTGTDTRTADLLITGLPREWQYTLKAGGYSISQLSVLPGDKKSVTLRIDIPRKVNKGNYTVKVVARDYNELPLVINISEQGTLKTEFTCDQINLQGDSKANFNFTAKLKNQTGDDQVYALQASPPQGWNVIFKPNYKQATAVELAPNSTSNISIEVKPPFNVEAGTYKIQVEAANRSTSASMELEVVITGTNDMELTTPTGLLSTKITAGGEERVELTIINTGTSELNDISLKSSVPTGWSVTFTPSVIKSLKPGEKGQVYADIKSYDKAIPGDYAATFTASTKETTSKASFRVAVKTPLIWGWVGILIILGTVGVIYFLFRKYGRR